MPGGLNIIRGNLGLKTGSVNGPLINIPKTENAWRDDGRCGASFMNAAGDPGECDPDNPNDDTCCSPYGWCGKTAAHCDCETCIEYSHTDGKN